jgi:hypothetical protein
MFRIPHCLDNRLTDGSNIVSPTHNYTWQRVQIIIIIIIIALQPFVGPWPLLQLLDPIHSRQETLDGGSALRTAATDTQEKTNTK